MAASGACGQRRTGGGFEYAGLCEHVREEELAVPYVGGRKVMVPLRALMRGRAANHPDNLPSKKNLEVGGCGLILG